VLLQEPVRPAQISCRSALARDIFRGQSHRPCCIEAKAVGHRVASYKAAVA